MNEIKVPYRRNRARGQSTPGFARLDQSPGSLTWRTVSPGAAAKAPLPAAGTLPARLVLRRGGDPGRTRERAASRRTRRRKLHSPTGTEEDAAERHRTAREADRPPDADGERRRGVTVSLSAVTTTPWLRFRERSRSTFASRRFQGIIPGASRKIPRSRCVSVPTSSRSLADEDNATSKKPVSEVTHAKLPKTSRKSLLNIDRAHCSAARAEQFPAQRRDVAIKPFQGF